MRRWVALALVTLAYAVAALGALGVAPLAPFLLGAVARSRAEVGFFVAAVYLGGVLAALPAGWLVDRLGVRCTLALGQAFVGAMVVAAAHAPSLAAMLACLVAAGFGFSAMNPATGKAVVEWFPPRERGVAMGVKQTGLTLGGIAGALLLPPLALHRGWRYALLVGGAASLAGALVVGVGYRSPAMPAEAGRPPRPRLGETAQLLRRPGLPVVLAAGFALSCAQAAVLAYLVLFAREVYALSAVAAARLLALAQLGGTLARLAAGVVSDRLFGGRRRPGIVAAALTAATVYALFALGPQVPAGLAAPLALVGGAGAFGWVGLYFALVAEIGGARLAGLLTGVAVAAAWSGVLVGPLAFGALLALAGSYAAPWAVLAAVAAAAGLTLGRLPPLVQREPVAPPPPATARSAPDGTRR